MVVGPLNPGVVVRLQDLRAGSPFVVPNQSLRVVGSLERFDAVSGIAVLTDGECSLRLDLEHLRELPLRVGSLFEFIGDLELHPLLQAKLSFPEKSNPIVIKFISTPKQLTLKARVGRNVDGRDTRVFDKVLQLRRRFEKEFRTN